MGRQNRSRKRHDEMNRIKRERYAKKELERLKKMLGIVDDKGNVDMKDLSEVAVVKTAKEIKKEKRKKEEEEALLEMQDKNSKGEEVEVVNEKTGKVHVFNTKTFKDQHGSHPAWYKAKRKSEKRTRKMMHSRKLRFKQAWTTANVPL